MTTTAAAPALSSEVKVTGLVCIAHLMSRFYALVAPPLIGWLLDTGHPRLVFLASAGALLLCASTMFLLGRARPASNLA